MAAGDHIYVNRIWYTHHGVEVYDGMVVHFSGTPSSKSGATIRKDSLEAFAHGKKIHLRRYSDPPPLPPDEAVRNAESNIGESRYHLVWNNCEHFARWCVTGKLKSSQVEGVEALGAVVAASTAAAAGGIGVITAVGEVAGLSGPGIMSGLATAGAAVGSGAVAELAVLGAAPGIVSAAVMHVALGDDPDLPEDERGARAAGRHASIAGVAAGGVTGVAAVSATGAVAGLSAAGISSGLATIVGVGGGMAAGSAMVICAPAVAAAGVGYGAYRLARYVKNPR
jgi:Lecithin retinol acyltransferase